MNALPHMAQMRLDISALTMGSALSASPFTIDFLDFPFLVMFLSLVDPDRRGPGGWGARPLQEKFDHI
jgi:hypothetical protein